VRAVTAKTTAERMRDLVKRRTEAGLKMVRNLWCHPDDEAAIREKAAQLQRARVKRQRKPKEPPK
jgi:hypothetical protein